MGIFGDILGGIESVLTGPIGQLGGQILLGRLGVPQPVPTTRFPGPPVAIPPVVSPGAFVPAGGGPFGQPIVDIPALRQLALTTLGGGPPMPGVFQTTALGGIVQAPQPIPFAIDPACPSFFRTGGQTARPTRFITATNPASGALTFWEHAGSPILFTRDLAVVKRVRRIASKAGTVTRRRTRKR